MEKNFSVYFGYAGIIGGFLWIFFPLLFFILIYTNTLGIIDFIVDGYIYPPVISMVFLFLGSIGLFRHFRKLNNSIDMIGSIFMSLGFFFIIFLMVFPFTGLPNPLPPEIFLFVSYSLITLGSIIIGISSYKMGFFSILESFLFAGSIPIGTIIGIVLLEFRYGNISLIFLTFIPYGISWILVGNKQRKSSSEK